MAIQSANVIRAACDGCPAVVYAEAPAKPKGVTGSVQIVDGNGREINVQFFACQVQHVGAAVRNVSKTARPVVAPTHLPTNSEAPIDLGNGLSAVPYESWKNGDPEHDSAVERAEAEQ